VAEARRIHLKFDADARLAAAAGSVARFLADAAGLGDDATSQFQSAILVACRESCEHLSAEHGRLEVIFMRLPDRLEVVLACQGSAAPAVELDAIAGFAAQPGAKDTSVPSGVDRVQHETQRNAAITRLTKFLAPAAPAE
jgi:hypothetical protein